MIDGNRTRPSKPPTRPWRDGLRRRSISWVSCSKRGDSAGAAEAFAKAAEADPRMAYAHYHAGMNYYKAKRIDQMAVYFENFLKLAPNAPEKRRRRINHANRARQVRLEPRPAGRGQLPDPAR